ncbi:MAG: DNA repair exonuclease [Chlamydiota bacterium]
MKNIRIACAADLHLGRRLVRLPEGLENFVHAPKDAWKMLVRFVCALENQVDVLILSGDVFDNEQDLYEAIGVFEEGIHRILANKIPIIAVAGNHDAHVLKKCHRRVGSPLFYLLGEDEMWETQILEFHGRKICFIGWSFSKHQCEANPLKSFKSCEDAFTIGILHCDVSSGKKGFYAPVQLKYFHSLPVKAWVLGHIHIPEILVEDPFVFYCGSLQGLDISERGIRGFRLLEVQSSGEISHQLVPCASLFWSSVEMDFSDVDPENFDEALCAFLRAQLHNIPDVAKVVLCRISFQGKTAFYSQVRAFAQKIEGCHFTQVGGGGIPCYIEEVSVVCTPDIDLEGLCLGRDLAALIAQLIRSVKQKEEGKEKLLLECFQHLQGLAEKNGHVEIKADPSLLELEFMRIGYEVLDMILMQEEGEYASFES